MESPHLESAQTAENNLEKITSILDKDTLDPSDISLLENWLEAHKEFGLEEMTDEEYYDFFGNGKFYLHSSAMFAGRIIGGGNKMKPMFLEALKDGYMAGGQILEERGKEKIGGSVGENAVSFDNQDIFSTDDPMPNHFKYALEGPIDTFGPVVLVSPAQLLETHSNLTGGKAEGWYFGSDHEEADDPSHEIPLSLFVMLMPNIRMKSSFAREIIKSLRSDENTREIAESEELQKYLKESDNKIELKEFMETLTKLFSEKGITMPRLSFYGVDVKHLNQEKDVEEIQNGVKEFLAAYNIEPNTDTNIPETHLQKVTDAERIEFLANLVRKKLK